MDKKEGARAIGGVEEDYADHLGGAILTFGLETVLDLD